MPRAAAISSLRFIDLNSTNSVWSQNKRRLWRHMLRRPGGSSERDTPDPIPNSAVKPLSAYGTSSQDAGESVAARSSQHMESKALFEKPYYVMHYVLGGPFIGLV